MQYPGLMQKQYPGVTIWDFSRITDRQKGRLEFPSLIRFRDHWYCAFREGDIHNNHPSGRARLIRSSDGIKWETVRIFDWDCGDVREPKLAVTGNDWLMMNTSVYFVSREPRPRTRSARSATYTPPEARQASDQPDAYYQLNWRGTVLNLPDGDDEPLVTQQSMTWLSSDGLGWSAAYACPTGINTWRWDVTWHNGMGYSVAQWGKDTAGTLYRTRDGKDWRPLKQNFFPKGHAGEGALAFGSDDTAYCLLRGGKETPVFIGIGKAPYYQDWEWKEPRVDYGLGSDKVASAHDVLGVGLGGPTLIRLSDGRFLGAGRALGPGRHDGRATVFWVEPEAGQMTLFAECDGTSYPGLVEFDGKIWITFVGSACHRDQWEIKLAKVDVKKLKR